MTRRHVCVVCPGLGGTGSVATVALKHAQELERYFRVTLVSNSQPVAGLLDFGFCAVGSRQFNFLRRFCHVPNEYAYVRATYRRLSALHAVDPIDAVVCHGHALAWFAGVRLRHVAGVPVALVVHADISDRPSGTYDFALTHFYKYVTPRAYRSVNLVVAVSPAMAGAAIQGGAPAHAVKIVPNGIDPAEIGLSDGMVMEARVARRAPPLSLLYIGRLAPEKGIDVLIKACRLLADAGISYHLRIVGSGPLESTYRAMTATLNLADQVEFMGPMERRKLGAMYLSSDIVCVPSISEPFGLVALEALISGRTVVASRVGGLPYIIQDGQTGVLVVPGSPEVLSQSLKAFAEDRASLAKFEKKALASAKSRFGWLAIGEKLRQFLDNMMENSGMH